MTPSIPKSTFRDPQFTLGILGAGQLGRMLALAARRMNVRTVVWTGGLEAPAVELANHVIDKPFDDQDACQEFCATATLATVEFENIPRATLDSVSRCMELFPSPDAIAICQNREREKSFLRQHGIPCTWFAVVSSAEELAAAMLELNGPSVLKTAAFGYDGKGQMKLEGAVDAAAVWAAFEADRAVLEGFVPFEKELSVMVARGSSGEMVTYDPAENRHRHHILDISIIPADVSDDISKRAQEIAKSVAEALDYRGLLGVEFFLLPDGELLVNEMAPRPHNSGHHTLNACATSQFEQQLRAVCGLPLGSTRLLSPVVMLNLLGDLWPTETTCPDWTPLFEDGEAYLHLYGKRRAIGRRKMGHANFLGATTADCLKRAEMLKAGWLNNGQSV
jgi:5-(carboxyamino)imidazole ribonucleotide synthase